MIPYFGYARQDRRPRSTRVPISAKVVANLLETVGVERVLTMDLHADQIQGFFDIPVDNIYASPVLLADLQQKNYDDLSWSRPTSAAWCAPGRWPSSSAATWRSSTSAARRPTCREVMHVIGEIDGRNCVIMDDMIDTAGTLVKAAEVLKERGAKKRVRLLHAPDLLGPGDRAHRQGLGARRSRGHQHHPAVRRGQGLQARSASCRWRPCSPRRSGASPRASR